MAHLCYRCGAKRSFRIAEARFFKDMGYKIEQDFPFKPTMSQIIRLCPACSKLVKSGGALGSKPIYHPVNEALKNA